MLKKKKKICKLNSHALLNVHFFQPIIGKFLDQYLIFKSIRLSGILHIRIFPPVPSLIASNSGTSEVAPALPRVSFHLESLLLLVFFPHVGL